MGVKREDVDGASSPYLPFNRPEEDQTPDMGAGGSGIHEWANADSDQDLDRMPSDGDLDGMFSQQGGDDMIE